MPTQVQDQGAASAALISGVTPNSVITKNSDSLMHYFKIKINAKTHGDQNTHILTKVTLKREMTGGCSDNRGGHIRAVLLSSGGEGPL